MGKLELVYNTSNRLKLPLDDVKNTDHVHRLKIWVLL